MRNLFNHIASGAIGALAGGFTGSLAVASLPGAAFIAYSTLRLGTIAHKTNYFRG